MPELPDLESYLLALRRMIGGNRLEKVAVRSPFVLRTFEPPIEILVGQPVEQIWRQGKRVIWQFPDERFLVFHLMIAGRFHWRKAGAGAQGKNDLAAFHFAGGILLLTEASQKKRASIHVLSGLAAVQAQDRGGLEPLRCSLADFRSVLQQENHTLKRALADPRLFAGIGNAYSDEILHAAGLSPLQWTSRLSEEQVERLFRSMQQVLTLWRDRLCTEAATRFPEKVTAFRTEMAVHGKFGEACPACGSSVQRIVYAENECNYCPRCQTGGKLLADRLLSRLLKHDWPRTIEEWEDRH